MKKTNQFTSSFYENIDGIISTIYDNNLNYYISDECTFYTKPLIVAETFGMKGFYQTIVPRITNTYEKKINFLPILELSNVYNFPLEFDQCCLWGNHQYEDLFEKEPQLICSFIKCIENNDSKKDHFLIAAKKFYIKEKCETFKDCIIWARMKFEELFNYSIQSLINQYPKDYKCDCFYFWENKKFPSPIHFNINDENHTRFIKSASILRAKVCGIEPEKIDIIQTASKFQPPEFIDLNEEFRKDFSDQKTFDSLMNELKPFIEQARLIQKLPNPETFSKLNNYDNDFSNACFDFIASTVNIRALNYNIINYGERRIEQYYRKIVPSLITTNSIIAGFSALELYKIHSIDKKIDGFVSGEIDLSIPLFKFNEPNHYKYFESINGMKLSVWDILKIESDLTFNEFIKEVHNKFNLNISVIECNGHAIYLDFKENDEIKLKTKISDFLKNKIKQPFNEDQCYLKLNCAGFDDEDNEIETPSFAIKIK